MDSSLKPLKFPLDYLTFIFTLFSTIAITIVFLFTHFETKEEADRDHQEMTTSFKQLHDDLGEARKEMNAKLDQLIRDKK